MTRDEICAVLSDLIDIDAGDLTGDEIMTALPGWDSLARAEFRRAALKRWGVALATRDVEDCAAIPDLLALVQRVRTASA